jgi:hypothetical protein
VRNWSEARETVCSPVGRKFSLVVAVSRHLTFRVSSEYTILRTLLSRRCGPPRGLRAQSSSRAAWVGRSRCLDYMCLRARGLAAEKLFHARRAPRPLYATPPHTSRHMSGTALPSGPAASRHYVAYVVGEVRARARLHINSLARVSPKVLSKHTWMRERSVSAGADGWRTRHTNGRKPPLIAFPSATARHRIPVGGSAH